MIFRNICLCAVVVFTTLVLSVSGVSAREKSNSGDNFCSEKWHWSGKVSASELREVALPVRNNLEVDGKQNGGISVRGENRNDILIRSCVVAWRESKAEAESNLKSIRINTDSVVAAENPDGDSWAVSYQILVPQNINLKLTAYNGGISVASINGTMDFYTKNGGLSLSDLAGNVIGKTQNGGVSVKLSGSSWTGSGLDIETRNGGVKISMPENYAANIDTGTRNGNVKSKISGLQVEDRNKSYNKRIVTNLNGGGAPIRIVTTNGGIDIDAR